MSNEHTPAPWIYNQHASESHFYIESKKMLTVPNGSGQVAETWCEADAALIAAAPDLYEALTNLLAVCDKNFFDVPKGYMRAAEAALYKADGRTD